MNPLRVLMRHWLTCVADALILWHRDTGKVFKQGVRSKRGIKGPDNPTCMVLSQVCIMQHKDKKDPRQRQMCDVGRIDVGCVMLSM